MGKKTWRDPSPKKQMAKKPVKGCSGWPVIGEMQIKTTIHLSDGYHSKDWPYQVLSSLWRKQALMRYWWEWKMVQPLWRRVWWFLKRLNTHLPSSPAIAHLSRDLQKWKHMSTQRLGHEWWMFTAALFGIAQIWKQPKRPANYGLFVRWNIHW